MNLDQVRQEAVIKMLKDQLSNMAFAIAEQAGELAVLQAQLKDKETKGDE